MGRRKHRKDRPPARLKPTGTGYVTRELTIKAQVRMRRHVHRASRKARVRMPLILRDLRRVLTSSNPMELVMTIAGWAMYTGIGDNAVAPHPFLTDVHQADVELLMALMAAVDARDWGRDAPQPETTQLVIDRLRELRRMFGLMRLGAMAKNRDPTVFAASRLQEQVRTHTHLVRNWGYHDRVIALSRALYAPLDEHLRAARGFGLSDVIAIYKALGELRQQQYNIRFENLRSVFAATTIGDAVRKYFDLWHEPASADDFIHSLPSGMDLVAVRYLLLAHADHAMANLSLLSPAEVAEASGVAEDVATRVLAETSLETATGPDDEVLGAFLDNPVWSRPALRYGRWFAIPTPQILFSHIHRVMNRILVEAGLSEPLRGRRATFLEDEVERLVVDTFPQARIQRGRQWQWEGRQYETDLIVMLDRTLLIVEAKSGGVTPSALRGAPDRLKKHVEDLIGKPSIQASRLGQVVRLAGQGDALALSVTEGLGIDTRQIGTIVRLSVTLEDVSFIASLEQDLKEARWIPEDLALSPVIALADLECVFHILEKPSLILHYLETRERVQKRVVLLADELDCLGSYLADGLVLPDHPGRPLVQLTGRSAVVDRYFIDRMVGFAPEKPRRHLPAYFFHLLDGLHARAPAGWTTVALAVLNGLEGDAAEDIDEGLEDLRLSVPRHRHLDEHLCSIIFVSNITSSPVVLYYVYCQADSAVRDERINHLAANAMAQSGRDRCIVIGRLVEAWEKPYAFIAFADAPPIEDRLGSP